MRQITKDATAAEKDIIETEAKSLEEVIPEPAIEKQPTRSTRGKCVETVSKKPTRATRGRKPVKKVEPETVEDIVEDKKYNETDDFDIITRNILYL